MSSHAAVATLMADRHHHASHHLAGHHLAGHTATMLDHVGFSTLKKQQHAAVSALHHAVATGAATIGANGQPMLAEPSSPHRSHGSVDSGNLSGDDHHLINADGQLEKGHVRAGCKRSPEEIEEAVMRKKLRNRESAQRARDRQKARMRWLEEEVTRITSKNDQMLKENLLLRQVLSEQGGKINELLRRDEERRRAAHDDQPLDRLASTSTTTAGATPNTGVATSHGVVPGNVSTTKVSPSSSRQHIVVVDQPDDVKSEPKCEASHSENECHDAKSSASSSGVSSAAPTELKPSQSKPKGLWRPGLDSNSHESSSTSGSSSPITVSQTSKTSADDHLTRMRMNMLTAEPSVHHQASTYASVLEQSRLIPYFPLGASAAAAAAAGYSSTLTHGKL